MQGIRHAGAPRARACQRRLPAYQRVARIDRWFLRYRLTSCDVYGGTVHVARVVRGEEDEGGGKFGWLTRTAHRGLSSELGDRLTLHRGRDDRGPHRAGRDAVCPEPVLHYVLGQ